ncbi:hypothetical protein LES9216_00070 [Leuconostoc suionicum]|uniref:Uncharacterized protein n=1 Tax=Leuconostoc suionicum TaxID=1511761 RepID=A0A2N9K6G5_9LACO|nr:hypothetical protein [Leuconostoc suionicum]SPD94521.1 hypothetical protein LES8486_01705 [Leuconostoc suionicum]SPE06183.1 hypothetical protein LES9216_00070 [Leuconostoc suionicum]SPH04954.1 hypothetical protein LES8484_01705 [Leuconostoc suionicum]
MVQIWNDGDIITKDRLNGINDSVIEANTVNSNIYTRGLFTSSFTVTDTKSWSYFLYKVKRNDVFQINTVTDGSQPTIMQFDEKMSLVSSTKDSSNNNVIVLEDGYLAVNMYMNVLSNQGDLTKVYVKGISNDSFSKNQLVSDKTSLTYHGYMDLNTADYPLTQKQDMVTTDYIPVTSGDYLLVTGIFGTGNGVIGFEDNGTPTSNPTILLRATANNEFVTDKVMKIPDGINFIRISTDNNYPFFVYKTMLSKENNDNNLPETTSLNFPSGSPLDYTYYRQFGRRDFYNKSDSFGEVGLDLNTNLFASPSNIMNQYGDGNFSLSQTNGTIKFSSPAKNGKTALQVKGYFPFSTERIKITSFSGNAFSGIFYGKPDMSTGMSVRFNSTSCVAELYVSGSIVQTVTYTGFTTTNQILQVQNTGRSLIILLFDSVTGNFLKRIGRFNFGANFDARKEEYTTTWKTLLYSQTDNFTSSDGIVISHFDSAIRSGANSVSIRFLTYEDGTFIQKDNYLYYLVEGTGDTISDLFTQIVKINPSTGDVQSIGAIFEVRNDGVDSGILLGDDSIKMVFDRHDSKWKGISCGMEYNDYGGNTSDRPKLYFETTQNILEGGIVIVRNAQQITGTDGGKVGTSETQYSEDFDFYWDDNLGYWVVTANTINKGLLLYSTPDLKTNYSTTSHVETVPTGVRDTGNQFVNFNGTRYITTGGTSNNLGIRDASGNYVGALNVEAPLSPSTTGPWCTLAPFKNGDTNELYLFSFDRVNLLYNGYDHGGLYCWKASKN